MGEQGQELVLGAVGRLGLGPRRLLAREQLHVAHGQRGLVGEGLQQIDLGLGERADLAVRGRDRADHLALGEQGDGQDGVMTGAGQAAPEVGREDDARLVENIGRPEGAALQDGAADEADAGWEPVAGLEVLEPLARDGHAGQRAVRL